MKIWGCLVLLALVGVGAPPPAPVDVAPRTVDLLPLIDLGRDRITGDWSKLDGTLTCAGKGWAHIEIPYAPPAEYDLRLLFVCSSGAGDMVVICYGGNRQFVWRMSGKRNGPAGFAMVDGKGWGRNPTSKQTTQWLPNGEQQELIIQVRKDGVSSILDENPVSSLATDYGNLTLSSQFAQTRADTLGIDVLDDDLTIEAAEVTEISGPGTVGR